MRSMFATAVGLFVLFAGLAKAETPSTRPNGLAPAGLTEVIRLWPNDPPATCPADPDDKIMQLRGGAAYMIRPGAVANLSVYLPKGATGPMPAVVICPGGGYSIEAVTGEGHAVAQALLKHNVASFVLKYRLQHGQPFPSDGLPLPQQDVLRAIQLVRAEAAKFNVDPNRVGVMGFSAGGHVAATAVTMYDDAKQLPAHDAISKTSARPDFGVLLYPVITMRTLTHGGSRKNLLGEKPDEALIARFSTDEHVTPQTPPLFIAVAEDDKTVPPLNSHQMDAAAAKAGIPHELVTYPKGGHGFGLGKPGQTQGWLDKALEWLADQKLMPSAAAK